MQNYTRLFIEFKYDFITLEVTEIRDTILCIQKYSEHARKH